MNMKWQEIYKVISISVHNVLIESEQSAEEMSVVGGEGSVEGALRDISEARENIERVETTQPSIELLHTGPRPLHQTTGFIRTNIRYIKLVYSYLNNF